MLVQCRIGIPIPTNSGSSMVRRRPCSLIQCHLRRLEAQAIWILVQPQRDMTITTLRIIAAVAAKRTIPKDHNTPRPLRMVGNM